ncbi:DUF6850 family outer membrane beta-barrel protein [Chitinophaga flava]|nr:DUF6850 family outer membrane beta-barrel protein [Chitinophaga flava]
MRTFSLLLFSLMMSAGAFAQQQGAADSVWYYGPALDRYRWSMQSIAAMQRYGVTDAGIASLEASRETGGFRLSQLPQQHSVVTFHSEGIRTLGRFKAYGSFSYSRLSDDSVSWQLQGMPDLDRPYYLAARKAGDFQRQRYQISGRVSYELLPRKVFVGTGVYYLYNTAYRTQDPRPAVKDFELKVSPDIAVNAGRHTLGLTPTLGYTFEKTEISYTNKQFQNNFDSVPERRTWMVMGMGYRQPRPGGDNAIRTTSNIAGITLTDVYSRKEWTFQMSAGYTWRRYRFGSYLESSLNESLWGTYSLEDYQLQAAVYKGQQHSWQLAVKRSVGDDINRYQVNNTAAALNGTNYTYRATAASLHYSFVAPAGRKVTPGMEADISMLSVNKHDYISTQHLQFTMLTPEVAGVLHVNNAHADRFRLKLSAGASLPVQTSAGVSALQLGDMELDVLYHDYYYRRSKALTGGLSAQYMTRRLLKSVPAGISAYMRYTQRLGNESYLFPEIRPVGPFRALYGISLNIYL